jgi:hypothetical protein
VLVDLVHLARDDLGQVSDDGGHHYDLSVEGVNPGAHFRKPCGSPVHLISEDLSKPLQRQSST